MKKTTFLLTLIVAVSYYSFSQPVISSISPSSGPVGTSVTISGSNFSSNASDNTVYFGAVKAPVISATLSALTVTAPAGATLQPVTVTANGLTGYAANSFVITYTGGGDINSTSFVNKTDYTTDLYPNGLVVKDFDGDGKSDLAVPNNYSITGQPASINVFRNTSTFGNISLGTKQIFSAGVQTYDIATGDLDGDGKPDIVSSSIGNSNFSAFINTSFPGTISFAAGITFPTANDGHGIAVGDIDGDGKPDVALVGYTNNKLSIFRNTSTPGSISFSAKIDFATTGGSEGIVVGDIDGDGKADIAITNSLFNSVSVFRSTSVTGTIAFSPRTDLSLSGATTPKGLILTDLSGDGKPDLSVVVKFSSGYCGTRGFRNNSTPGNINFGIDNGMSTNNGDAYRVAAGDVNGDGIPDLALGESSNSRVSVGQNIGVGGGLGYIGFKQALSFYAAYSFATGLADLDGDGKPELISTFGNGSTLSVYRNNCGQAGISRFTPTEARTGQTVYIYGNFLSGVTSVSFGGVPVASFTVNDASYITAVVGNGASGDVAVSGSTGSANLSGFYYLEVPIVSSFSPTSAGAGNTVTITGSNFSTANSVKFGGKTAYSFTRESSTTIKAIVDTSGATGVVQVFNNNGSGSQPGFTYVPMAITGISPSSAGTGATVTITGNNFSGVNAVSIGGTPATSFTLVSPTTITAVVGGGSSGTVTVKNAIAQADFSGFVFASPPAPSITSITAAAGIVPGNTVIIDGSNFNPVPVSNTVYFGAAKGSIMAASATQLIVTIPYGATYGSITVLNNATGLTGYSTYPVTPSFAGSGLLSVASFSNRIDFVTGYPITLLSAIASDVDQDGKPDLVFSAANSTNAVMLVRNNSTMGSISLAAPIALNIAPADYIKVGDVDGDGKPDIITSPNTNKVGISRNTSSTGNVSFAPVVNINTHGDSQILDLKDIDGDGKPDIICPNYGAKDISVIRNTGTPGTISFAARQDYTCSGNTKAAVAGDLDNDGKPDVAVISSTPHTLNVFGNTSTPGNISLVPVMTSAVGDYPFDIKMVDIDGDHLQEIIVLNSSAPVYVSVFKNTSTIGNISFAPKVDYPISGSSSGIGELGVGDLDGDGKVDIIASLGTISLFKNISTPGTLALSSAMPIDYGSVYSACVADLDADKKPEIIVSLPNWYQYSVFKNNSGEMVNRNVCPPAAYTSLSSGLTAQSYQWMVNTGSGFITLANNANYSGTTTATLYLSNIPSSWSGYQYMCKGSDNYSNPADNQTYYSNNFVLKFVNTWTGAVSNAWENSSNWSCGTVPDSNTDVIINSGSVMVNSNITVGSLKLAPSVNLTIKPPYNLTIKH